MTTCKHSFPILAATIAVALTATLLIAADAPQTPTAGANPISAAVPHKSRPLFDGRTFRGWEGDTQKSFRIEEGAIVGGSLKEPIPHNEFLCTTQPCANFVLRLECKLIGPGNAGIQIRSQRVPHHHEVSGYQADMSGDGFMDAVFSNYGERNEVCYGIGGGALQCLDTSAAVRSSTGVAVGSVNGDGYLDAVFSNGGQANQGI